MNNYIINFLKYTGMILINKDKTHRFNIYNPLAYVALFIFALVGCVSSALLDFFKFLYVTVKESIVYKFESGVVLWIVGGLIFLTVKILQWF